MDGHDPIKKNIDVGITGQKITYMEPTNEIAPPSKRIVDGTNKVLMPGLYNCHTHAAMTLFRGYANDRALEDWLFNYIFPAEQKLTASLTHTGTMLAIAEMIASGTIAFSDMYFFMDEVAKAADEAGVLANVSNAVIGLDKDNYDFYKDNVYSQSINALEQFHKKGDKRIKIDASIHGVYTSFAPAWEQVMDFASSNNLGLHIHLSETKTEHENCIKTYGMTPTQIFDRHGLFEFPTLAAHGVWVSDEDIAILSKKGVNISHNPISNLKLASGLAPVDKMQKKGVNVAIGTDGMAANNSHDLFEEIKMASLLQKYALSDPTATPAYKALEMATVYGAKAQGRDQESGRIKLGYDADIIMLDFDNVRQTACYDPTLNLAYTTTGRDVEMTLCRGKILYEKGEYKTIDIEKLLHKARQAMHTFTGDKR